MSAPSSEWRLCVVCHEEWPVEEFRRCGTAYKGRICSACYGERHGTSRRTAPCALCEREIIGARAATPICSTCRGWARKRAEAPESAPAPCALCERPLDGWRRCVRTSVPLHRECRARLRLHPRGPVTQSAFDRARAMLDDKT